MATIDDVPNVPELGTALDKILSTSIQNRIDAASHQATMAAVETLTKAVVDGAKTANSGIKLQTG